MASPARPADIPDETPIRRLAEGYWWETETLADHAQDVAPLTTELHRSTSLAALAYSAKIAARLDAERWPLVVEALSTGASSDQVASAMEIDEDALVGGVVHWANKQRLAGRITAERRSEIEQLVVKPRRNVGWWSI